MEILITFLTLAGGIAAAITLGDRFEWGRGEPADAPPSDPATAHQLVYLPEIRDDTVLLLIRDGATWDLRDYSGKDAPALIDGDGYEETAEEILAFSSWSRPVNGHRADDVGYWRDEIEHVNAVLLDKARPAVTS